MKILIIEDEPEIVEFLKRSLAPAFLVEAAEDGERGAFMARTGAYDLIILDSCLPKMSGPEVLRDIRQDKDNLPIIMLTVKGGIADKEAAFAAGADDYLTKPFLLDELLLRIRALLRRPAANHKKGAQRLADLSFQPEAGSFRRGQKEIYLTRREYGLLEYLWRRRDEIVSRGEILDNVWDYNADPFSNSIETHIASLRRKLNHDGKANLIHTFPGRGYKLALKKIN